MELKPSESAVLLQRSRRGLRGLLGGVQWLRIPVRGLSRIAYRVAVAHPGQLGLIFRFKGKNDRMDAKKLVKLLFRGEAPPVYVPNHDVRARRRLIVFRNRLSEGRTRVKNRSWKPFPA